MTPETWADALATIRYIFDNVLQIVTVVVGGLAAYYAYRSKIVGDRNSGQLVKQDATLAKVADKVEAVQVAVAESADPLRRQVDGLAETLAAIRRDPGA